MTSTWKSLQQHPGAVQARKRPIPVDVIFASGEGICQTREGNVSFQRGDALVKGPQGDCWPIGRDKFEETYEPVSGQTPTSNGFYRKKPLTTWALQLEQSSSIEIGSRGDVINGEKGDWLVQYGDDDFGIVSQDIFDVTYEILS